MSGGRRRDRFRVPPPSLWVTAREGTATGGGTPTRTQRTTPRPGGAGATLTRGWAEVRRGGCPLAYLPTPSDRGHTVPAQCDSRGPLKRAPVRLQ